MTHYEGSSVFSQQFSLPAFRTDPANTANIREGVRNGLSIFMSFCEIFSLTIDSGFSSVFSLPCVLSGSFTVINMSIPTRIPGIPDMKNAHLQPYNCNTVS